MIIGIDEVGRGAWAGPLVVGAVQLRAPIAGLKDSKLLTRTKREELALLIEAQASFIGLGWVSVAEVDALGLTKSLQLACMRATEGAPDAEIIIDGNSNFLADNPRASSLIKADATVPAVSAASIVAKVARDKYMAELSCEFPAYSLEKHVGYGTALHSAALQKNGITSHHRLSFKPVAIFLHL